MGMIVWKVYKLEGRAQLKLKEWGDGKVDLIIEYWISKSDDKSGYKSWQRYFYGLSMLFIYE